MIKMCVIARSDSDEAIPSDWFLPVGLLRFARNDEVYTLKSSWLTTSLSKNYEKPNL